MLYVIPAQEKLGAPSAALHRNLNTNDETGNMLANMTQNSVPASGDSFDERTRLLVNSTPTRCRRQTSNNNINNNNEDTETTVAVDMVVTEDSDASDKQTTRQTTKKPKLGKLGSKSVGLKRVSFGSSKGSMVETLVFETPTPLSEHAELKFGFETESNYKTSAATTNNINSSINMDDSGIVVNEEQERSVVRVSIYHSSRPLQICPPDHLTTSEDSLVNSFSNHNYNFDDMTASTVIPGYERQQSTDSGWDNPFRPGGDLAREADEIVSMIKGGKPITPTGEHSLENGNAHRDDKNNANIVEEIVTNAIITQTQSAQNGTSSHNRLQSTTTKLESKSTSQAQVSKQMVPGPTTASHVNIDEKKKKTKGCCVIQ